MNYGFIIDNRKCIGCHACTVACKSEHDVAVGVNRTWVKYVEKGAYPDTRRLFSVMRCNHCEDAPCVEICPVEALHIRDDGIVDFDNRRCIGCKSCMQACPYDALYIDPKTQTAAKCNYCSHRIDVGLEPACVNVCPEHAIISGDMNNPNTEIAQLLSREQVKARKTEKGTKPNLFYIDADQASLVPSETETSDNYMWNSQSSGVGHYAKYAESLVAKSDPVELYKIQAAKGVNNPDTPEKVKPVGDNTLSSPKGILQDTIRRAYDAPSKGVLWGWEVSAYVLTKAIAAGMFLIPFLAVLNGLFVGEVTQWTAIAGSLGFLGLTGALLVKDLDKPTRFAYVLLRPQWNSWLVRGGYAITVFGGLVTLWGAAKFFNLAGLERFAFWGAAIFAIIVSVYTAFLFAQAKGRDFWQSPALILHMLVHPFLAGSAIFALIGGTADMSSFLNSVISISVVANLLIIFAELFITHPTTDAKKTADMIRNGRFSKQFWLGAIIIGNLIPLIFTLFVGTSMLPVAGVLILIGLYVTEHIWVRAPQMITLS